MTSDSTQSPAGPGMAPGGSAPMPPNGPDYGQAPPFTQPVPPFGASPFPGMPPGMPPFGAAPFGAPYPGMPGYGPSPFAQSPFPPPGYGPAYAGMDMMMSQVMDRAAFLQRLMITMSNMAAEFSRACQMLAQNPSQLGSPFCADPAFGGGPAGEKPVDLEALKHALTGMDPVQAQKILYAVQMMQWAASTMRQGQPGSGQPVTGQPGQPSRSW